MQTYSASQNTDHKRKLPTSTKSLIVGLFILLHIHSIVEATFLIKMAEAVALGASIIAIFQIADRIIGLCKLYIETVRDAPSDLRTVLIETSTMKTILENVQFLMSCNNRPSAMLDVLSGADGPIEGCRSAIAKMEELFPSGYAQGPRGNRSKRQKVKASLATLAWPLKESRAKKLVEEVIRYKSTINLALTTEYT
jgi:hypothetical protein